MFLRNGVDEEVPPPLDGCFRRSFVTKFQELLLAVTATALKVVLDEIASSGEVTFRVATYTPIYLEMLGLMNKCDTSSIHAAKMKALQTEWVRIGSNGMKEDEATAVATMDFDVELD
ncbi:hypothetical protein EDD15DRAFT_2374330 [Pisolithus albus]|nr:hypothetical protein EDD15DRAFT_2374330 [Pisolithus albus]